jgi:hypothetical protein
MVIHHGGAETQRLHRGESAYPLAVFELFASVCFLVGGWWIFRCVLAIVRGIRSRSWPSVEGEIRDVKIVKKFVKRGREIWREEVEYRYYVNGTRHRGTRRQFGVPARYDWNHGREQPYRKGESVDVIYSASRPSVSALTRGFSPFAFIPLVVGGWIVWAGVKLLMV